MDRPRAKDAAVRARMQRQRRSGTAPEMALRIALWRPGLRYRTNVAIIGRRRKADIVFTKAKVAVFVDGCFWHCCPDHGTVPLNNREWWQAKLAANVQRDRDTDLALHDAGWLVTRVWEHEDPIAAARRVRLAVEARRGPL
ncbi:MAG: very short patch repair endonuclease [Ilumatobacteraceae bacterium]